MVSSAALVLVLLHLHASDTLRKDSDEMKQTKPPNRMTLVQQPSIPSSVSPSAEQHRRIISREDEDLLDLMVRIAETPAEWERIHRVLNEIGKEKETYKQEKDVASIDSAKESATIKNGTSSKNSMPNTSSLLMPIPEGNSSIGTIEYTSTDTLSTSMPVIDETRGYRDEEYQNDVVVDVSKVDNTDSGWPDFDEAITKKIKKHHNVVETNNIVESDWFEDEWLDSWNDFWGEQQKQELFLPEIQQKNEAVGFTPQEEKDNSEDFNYSKVPKSRLYSDPKILQFPLKPITSTQTQHLNQGSDESNRTARPVFQYHRVTTSPQERRGNSAFIAVSVVKQSPPEPPATTAASAESLESPWSHARHLHRIQDHVKSTSANELERNHDHWGKQTRPHHNRGHRHHHPHTHGHP